MILTQDRDCFACSLPFMEISTASLERGNMQLRKGGTAARDLGQITWGPLDGAARNIMNCKNTNLLNIP